MDSKDVINRILQEYNISAKELARSIGMERADTIYHIQKGRNGISRALAKKIHDRYGISIEWLRTGAGEMKKESKQPDVFPVSDAHVMYVPLVGRYAYAGYLSGFGDEEYMESLPTVPFVVDHPGKGSYLSFEVRGDSMDDGSKQSYVEGEILLCREVHMDYWRQSSLHIRNWDFVIVHRDEGILVKEIVAHDVGKHTITIHSRNPFYQDQVLDLNDIHRIFNVVSSLKPRKK